LSREKWEEAAEQIARAAVSVMPQLNEFKIKARVYAFFASEDEYSASIYNDNNYYYVEDISSILETAFDGSAGDEASMIVSSDFRWAFDQLSDSYQYRILERYQHSVVRPHDSPERAQLNRAVRKLADVLNTWNRYHNHVGTGSREVWSNARSRAEIGKNSGDIDNGTWANPIDFM
jgi:hypothetical protein